ncbi:MAG: S41 family peptidase [Flavobacteriaceae bacterium]
MKHFNIILILTLVYSCANKKTNLDTNESLKTETNSKGLISISNTLRENSQLSIEKQIELYYKLKKENPEGYNFDNEDELTMYGYSFLWNNQVEEAIEIFKLIVAEFPESSNSYDSLGEGYMANGDMELALLNYQKSLELNPDNFNAEDQIERIKFPNKKPLTPAEKFVKVYSVQEYKNDLDQLGSKLLEIHPNALKFISKDDFLNLIETKKKLITKTTTYGDFIWHCSEIISSINCSHTSLGSFSQESTMISKPLVFPLQTRLVEGKLFVIDAMSNPDRVNIKDEITSINGVEVSKLVADIFRHIESQGYVQTSKVHFFNAWSTEMIPYALGFPESYSIKVNNKSSSILLNQAQTFKVPYTDESIKKCENNLCLEFLENNDTAILTISSFNFYPWNNLNEFETFIDESFKKLKEQSIKNLIIDLRFNGGGSPESSIYLLKYLMNKPFTYFTDENIKPHANSFKGQLYFLIDGNGKSTTGHFMALAKHHKLGIIIGEELGSNQMCTAGQTVCRLTNTKLVFYVANTESRLNAVELPDEKGILPDYYITQNIDDYLNKVDSVKEFAINLINDK